MLRIFRTKARTRIYHSCQLCHVFINFGDPSRLGDGNLLPARSEGVMSMLVLIVMPVDFNGCGGGSFFPLGQITRLALTAKSWVEGFGLSGVDGWELISTWCRTTLSGQSMDNCRSSLAAVKTGSLVSFCFPHFQAQFKEFFSHTFHLVPGG